jgi:PKD repeat protein
MKKEKSMKLFGSLFFIFSIITGSMWAQDFNYTVHNRSEHDIYFEVPSGQNIHHIVVNINFEAVSGISDSTIGNFSLTFDDDLGSEDFTDTSLTLMDPINDNPWGTTGISGEGKYISLYQETGDTADSNKYILDIVEKDHGAIASRGVVVNDEVWTLSLGGFGSSENIIHVTIGMHIDSDNLGSPGTWTLPGIPYPSYVTALREDQIVLNSPPIANFALPSPTANPGEFSFNAAASNDPNTNPPPDTIDQFQWTWGDTSFDNISVANTTNTYSSADTFGVELKVVDNHGAVSDVFSRSVTYDVPEVGPIASFTTNPDPPEDTSPLSITFTDTSTPGSNPISTYLWNFNDNSTDSTSALQNPTHTFLTGEYEVNLTVTDTAPLLDNEILTVKVYPNQEISFPPHRGLPYAPDPPTIDGSVEDDTGWRGAHRLTYGTGADPADLRFQAIKDRVDEYIYLSFEIRNDLQFDADDLIVLNFRPDKDANVPANDRKIFIFPFAGGEVADVDKDPQLIRIWQDSSAWDELNSEEVDLIGIEAKISFDDEDMGAAKYWNLELRIPTTAGIGTEWVNFSNNFLFYFNVNKVNSGSTVNQFIWPIGCPDITGDVASYVFAPEWWGRGNKSSTAVLKGVYLESGDIGTTNIPSSKILLPDSDPGSAENTFFALVKNTSERETNVAPEYAESFDAEFVRARFKIANWGIPATDDWIDLPSDSGSALTPLSLVPKAVGGVPGEEEYNLVWTIALPVDDTEVTNYTANDHQCIHVEVDSTTDTNIITKSVYRNMNFGTASIFSQPAEVSTRGYGAPPDGQEKHRFLIIVNRRWYQQDPDKKHLTLSSTRNPSEMDEGTSAVGDGVEWSAHGYLYTGKQIIINGTAYDIVKPVGSFGHVLTHDEEVVTWEYELEGAEEEDDDLFVLEVAEDSSVMITPKVWPVEFLPYSLSIHAGSITPIGTLANNYSTGFTAFADFGWRFKKQLMIILFSGINWFPEKSGGQVYWNISTNLDVRYLLPLRGKLLPYVQAGPGIYYDDSNTVSYGVNSGLGISYKLNSRLNLELGADYHVLMDPVIQFMTAHGGVVFKF